MTNDWFIQVMGEVQGPLNSAQIKQLARIGQIVSDTPVRRGERGNWVTADQVQGLFAQHHGTQKATPSLAPPVELPHKNGAPPRPPNAAPMLSQVKAKSNSLPQRKNTIVGEVVYAIDPMFKRYLTPWIIRCTWCLVLLAALLGIGLFFFVDVRVLANAEPDMSEVAHAEFEVDSARQLLQRLEEIHERFAPSEKRRARSAKQEATQPPTEKPQDPIAEAKRQLADAERRLVEAKSKVESKWSAAMKLLPGQVILLGLQLIASTLAVLWLRVILESGIVLFNIVTKLGSIDDRLAAMNNQPMIAAAAVAERPTAEY